MGSCNMEAICTSSPVFLGKLKVTSVCQQNAIG